MKHLSKRIFALALVLAMVLSMVPAIPAAAADSQTAQLVSDVNDLKIGDRIIIVATDYTAALGTTQNSNNRSASTVSKSGSSVTFDESTQIITLGQGSKSGTYTLEVGEGQYLAATSSTSNSLRTVTTLQDSASWSISIDTETGVAKIVSAGTTSRNEMRYNLSSKLFACYQSTSTQKTVQIYRLSQQPEYYLVGYINGANYGCEEDYQNLGQYKFVNGQLSVAFENDSYVFIKTGDNQN
jgi:hypothetical protein